MPMQIISLQADNIKRLRSVQITPEGDLVIVSGENGAGKSSTLDAIEMALRGKDAIPGEPLRRGEKKGRIVLDLGDRRRRAEESSGIARCACVPGELRSPD